jgi:hypothetical protein
MLYTKVSMLYVATKYLFYPSLVAAPELTLMKGHLY